MMKRIATLTFLLLSAARPAWSQGRPEVVVQGQEKIILKKDAGQQTTIEIKNGKVYIDGDEIASADDTRSGKFSKKIIIEGSGRSSSADGGSGDGGNDPDPMRELMKLFEGLQGANGEAAAPKAMLGVSTEDQPDGSMNGAVVRKVEPGTPAEKAGLKEGDLITAIDGKPVIDGPSLVLAVREHKPGDEIAVKYKRGKQEKTAKATLAAAPGAASGNMPGDGEEGSGADAMPNPFGGGLSLGDMMRGMNGDGPKLGITGEDVPGNAGVRIATLDPKGAAAKAGLQEGDIITSIGTTATTDLDALQMALGNSRDKDALQIDYLRNGRKGTVQIVPGRRRDF